jgi:hypothetical protein
MVIATSINSFINYNRIISSSLTSTVISKETFSDTTST